MTSSAELKRRCPLIGCICFLIFAFLGILCLGIGILLYCQFDSLFGDVVKRQMVINDDNEFWWYDHWLKPTGRETLTVHVFKIENTDELRQNWLETLSSASAPKTLDNQKKKSKINRSSTSSSSSRTQSQSQSSSRSRTNRNSKSQKQEKDIATVVNRLQPQIREIGPFVFRYV